MSKLRPIFVAVSLAAVLVTPALADEDEDSQRFRLMNYSLALAEAMGQSSGISAQCFGAPDTVSKGRVAVLDVLEFPMTTKGLIRAAEAYDLAVLEMRARYASSCDGAEAVHDRLAADIRRYGAEIAAMLGFGEKPAEKTGKAR